MTGCIDQVEYVVLTVAVTVVHSNEVRLYGDAAFPFQIHRIQHLFLQFPTAQSMSILQQAVSQGGFPVINMSNDAKISNIFDGHSVFHNQSFLSL